VLGWGIRSPDFTNSFDGGGCCICICICIFLMIPHLCVMIMFSMSLGVVKYSMFDALYSMFVFVHVLYSRP
jgi:hypothetical protein